MEFILLLHKHRTLGWMIRPALADAPDNSGKRALERFVPGVAVTAGIQITASLSRILEWADSCSDYEITRRFAPKGVTPATFLKNPDQKRIQELIHPFIWRQVDRILREAKSAGLLVARSEESAFLYPEMILEIPGDHAIPVFHFSKTSDQTSYILKITQNDIPVGLQNKHTMIIASDPCWLCAGNRLIHFPGGFDGKKIQPFLTKTEILIPASAEKEYFRKFILKVAGKGVVHAEGFTVRTVNPEKRIILSAETDWQGRAGFVVWFHYDRNKIMAGKTQKVFTGLEITGDDIVVNRAERDFIWEASMIEKLSALGLQQGNENSLKIRNSLLEGRLSLYELVEWINRNRKKLNTIEIETEHSRLSENYFTGTISSDFRVEMGTDWFDVTAVVYFGDIAVPFRELKRYLLDGIREFPLPGGEVAVLPAEWFTRFKDLFWFAREEEEKIRLNIRHFSLISDLDLPPLPDITDRLEDLYSGTSGDFPVPASLTATLRPYQVEGFRWLRFLAEHRFGGCLADDMGLGKTIQAISVVLSANQERRPASLIVMPASLIHNWVNEISRFAPSLRVMKHTGNQRAATTGFFDSVDMILTTYGILRTDIQLLSSYRFHYVILDESQFIKNPDALTTRAALELQSNNRLVLTGTPIENSLSDLWSQMEFLNPGLLGPHPAFRKRFLETEKKIEQEPEGDQAVRLKRIVAPFILRRTKQEVEKDLPPLVIEHRYCEMSEEQERRYEMERSAVRNEILKQIETNLSSSTTVAMLRALTRLRQTANHPVLTDPEYTGDSGKFEEIFRNLCILHEEGHKTLIFSSFVKHLMVFSSRFEKEHVAYSILTGATVKREQVIRRFRDDRDIRFFLISLKAGGTGLNLTEASYVVLLDPWWNPAAELQAINRAHRIGQDKKVIAYKFITENTIEEKMLSLQQRKQQLSDTFVPSGNPLKDLTQEELKELFR